MPSSAAIDLIARNRHRFGVWLHDVAEMDGDIGHRWDMEHIGRIKKALAMLQDGRIDRLMIEAPPRHLKSELVTIRHTAWWLEQNQSKRVIIGCYGQTLANRFSRRIRAIARYRGIAISSERQAVDEWELSAGGGLKAVGVGAGVTGSGADLIVIDDPVKSREEADSKTYRDRVWEWFTNDLSTRLEPDGKMILIMTRWHPDDLAGRIMGGEGADRWHRLKLPAINPATGKALWEARFSVEHFARTRREIGDRAWNALYMQEPTVLDGEMFPSDMAIISATPPSSAEIVATVMAWDKGASTGGDYTVGVLMAITSSGVVWVLDVVRGRWLTHERRKTMRKSAERCGIDTPNVIEIEGGSSGVDAYAADAASLAGYPVRGVRPTGSKILRAELFSSQWQAGNVRLLRGRWNTEYTDELAAFPAVAHDDQVDASSLAYSQLAGGLGVSVSAETATKFSL